MNVLQSFDSTHFDLINITRFKQALSFFLALFVYLMLLGYSHTESKKLYHPFLLTGYKPGREWRCEVTKSSLILIHFPCIFTQKITILSLRSLFYTVKSHFTKELPKPSFPKQKTLHLTPWHLKIPTFSSRACRWGLTLLWIKVKLHLHAREEKL